MSDLVVSIIIINWNAGRYLEKCLSSIILNNPGTKTGVYVVDNASTDGSLRAVHESFPAVKVLANTENHGFASANNQAITETDSQFLLLLNPDTILKPLAVDRMLALLQANPSVGVVGPRLLNPDGSLQTSCYPFPNVSRELWRLLHLDRIVPYGSYRQDGWGVINQREVDSMQGACLLIRREALDQVGYFDNTYFMYTEEIDLCYRIKKAGWKLVWEPQAEVIHYGGQSTRQVAEVMFLELYKSKVKFFRKHYGALSALIYKMILFFVSIPRLFLAPYSWLEKQPAKQRHQAVVQNYLHLINDLPKF